MKLGDLLVKNEFKLKFITQPKVQVSSRDPNLGLLCHQGLACQN